MSRVSENSSRRIIDYSLNRNKRRMEDLQYKGASLKSMVKPSDNPVGNVENLTLKSRLVDNEQFTKNSEYAKTFLSTTEQVVESLTEIVGKAKEIAIAQSSDFYSPEARSNIANEIIHLREQALALGNKRIGQKHLFSGFKSLTPPFDTKGNYFGDDGHIHVEVSKDFFVPINLTGREIFFGAKNEIELESGQDPLSVKSEKTPQLIQNRDPASNENSTNPNTLNQDDGFSNQISIFSQLEVLASALQNDDSKLIQSTLDNFDVIQNRLVTLRTRIGSISNSIMTSQNTMEKENIDIAERKSSLEDADITKLFSDIVRQQDILTSSYKATQGMLQQSLLKFLR
jgi:flagellar hook-associated protein 3 FlgL